MTNFVKSVLFMGWGEHVTPPSCRSGHGHIHLIGFSNPLDDTLANHKYRHEYIHPYMQPVLQLYLNAGCTYITPTKNKKKII